MAGKTLARREEHRGAFQLGEWVVEPELNLLRRGVQEHRVEPKVMQVLLALAERLDHVVSKEELIAIVWPDTFVSDDVLTRCISILRRVTQDDSHAPRFIQTVPKRGYRLLAPLVPALPRAQPDSAIFQQSPVHESPEISAVEPELEADALGLSAVVPANVETRRWRRPELRRTVLQISLVGLLILCGLGFALTRTLLHRVGDRAILPANFRTVQFTTYAGEQTQPAFSPDGGRIAYVATSEDSRTQRIYIKTIGSQIALQLTPGSGGKQFSPAWSHDGKDIAFLTQDKAGYAIAIARADGLSSQVRRVYTPHEPSHWEQGALAWSPDGGTLIFPDHAGSQSSSAIFALDLRSGKVRALTAPPDGWEGDLTPAFSPDGKCIAFTRASETAVRDIYWLALADGRLHALTHDHKNIDSLAWSADGRSIVFSSNQGGKYALWTIGVNGGVPRRLPVGTEDAFEPSLGPKPGQLAYAEGSAIWSIVRVREGSRNAEPEALLTSTQQDSAPAVSPDGRSLSFQSLRSGSQEIWIASIDGSALRQLTFAGGPLTGSPAWSRHGDRIAFDSRPDGHSHIFTVPALGGRPAQLTFGDSNDIVPRWSHDDHTIYYRSNRGGRWQLWKVPAAGGVSRMVTSADGIEPEESADGLWLYYTRGDEAGLWRMPVDGGAETRILTQPAAGYWGYWQLLGSRVYYLDLSGSRASIRVANVTAQGAFKPGDLYAELSATPPHYAGLSIAEQGRAVIMTEERDAGRHITLVQPQ